MLSSAMLQIVVFLTINGHTSTYTVPKLYPITDNSCYEKARLMQEHKPKHGTAKFICVPAPEGFRYINATS